LAGAPDFLGGGFVEVTTVRSAATAARRKPAAATLSSTGLLAYNTNATELQDQVAKALGESRDHYYAKPYVDTAKKTIAIVSVNADTAGATEVRRNTDGKTITMYLHGVFEEHPELRPAGDTEVKVTLHSSGKATIINLASGGLGVRHIPRDSSSEESSKDTTK
jgi:hypothetical protein